jgi:hypothetical protein
MNEPGVIRCELCGREEAASLLRHLREAHGLGPEAYQTRCPGSPLFTPGFGQCLRDNGIGTDSGKRVRRVNLFGVALTAPALLGGHVPEGVEKAFLNM